MAILVFPNVKMEGLLLGNTWGGFTHSTVFTISPLTFPSAFLLNLWTSFLPQL